MGSEAINLYRQMPENIQDTVTHICILNACSHCGLVNEARSIFHSIKTKTEQIYSTMVRLLIIYHERMKFLSLRSIVSVECRCLMKPKH